MFDSLTSKFENIFDKLKSSSRITDSDIETVSNDIRNALIDADVNISVINAFVEKIAATQIDILVNNAGIIMRSPAVEHPDEYWDKVLSINLDAQFILTKAIAKQMLERGKGKIIFTCSLLTFQGGINVPGYAAAKSALGGLIKAFANEWAAKGVCVNGIAPGYIETDNTTALREDAERNKSILDRIPAKRWGVPDDFKGPVVFLASEASNYVNGAILLVDGGWMAR